MTKKLTLAILSLFFLISCKPSSLISPNKALVEYVSDSTSDRSPSCSTGQCPYVNQQLSYSGCQGGSCGLSNSSNYSCPNGQCRPIFNSSNLTPSTTPEQNNLSNNTQDLVGSTFESHQ